MMITAAIPAADPLRGQMLRDVAPGLAHGGVSRR